MTSLSPLEHTAIGGVAGIVEILVAQPSIYMKNALQQGRSITFRPSVLYRGLAVNASAAMPITALQFGVHRLTERTFMEATQRAPSSVENIGFAMTAGATSSLIGCPAEFIMIQQQSTGAGFAATVKNVYKTYGITKFYKGLAATAGRESVYAAGYLGIAPLLRKELANVKAIDDVPGASLAVAGIASGLIATVFSHPFDSVKTRMQGNPNNALAPQYSSLPRALYYSLKHEGVRKLFSGLLPRSVRLVVAVFILTGVRNTLIDVVEEIRR